MAKFTLIPLPKNQWLDTNGKLLPGARLYSWHAGTTTPAPLYTTSSGTVELPNPAEADGSGRLTAYMPSNTTYKLELRTSTDVSIWIQDGVEGVPGNEVDLDIEGVAGEALADRDVVFIANGSGGTTAGRWYKGDADIVDRSTAANVLGLVPQAIAAGASGTIRQQGKVEGFTGLTPGAAYYISQVAGALTSVAPPNARFIGIADKTTSLVISVSGVAQAQPADPIFNSVQISSTNASALDVAGGIVAGTGNVQVVDATGKIPAIDSTRFANLSGTNLTGVTKNASNETVTGSWTFGGTVLALSGPAFLLIHKSTTAAANEGGWFFQALNPGWRFGALNDANASINDVIAVARAPGLGGATLLTLGVPLVAPSLRVTGIGAAEAGKIGLSGNQLVLLGGPSGHGFFTSAGGLTTSVDAAGNWSMLGRINSATAQPGFLAHLSASTGSLTTATTIVFNIETFDDASNYNTATGIFTATVAGRYLFTSFLEVTETGGLATRADVRLVTSNRTYQIGSLQIGVGQSGTIGGSVIADMDVGDTALVRFMGFSAGGTVNGSGLGYVASAFSGRLLP